MSILSVSICIPTYNMGTYLEELLTSIHVAHNHFPVDVEVCISDNCSLDNTKEVINKFSNSARIPYKINFNTENIGPDRNYLLAAELATKEFIWLMGSDDRVSIKSFEVINELVKESPSIIIFPRIDCDKELRPKYIKHWYKFGFRNRLWDLKNTTVVQQYLNKTVSLGGLFSYLSSIVIESKLWEKGDSDPLYIGSGYLHVFKILTAINKSNDVSLQTSSLPIVYCRHGNDSFNTGSNLRRALLDFDGYFLLSETINHLKLKKTFLKVLLREHGVLSIFRFNEEKKTPNFQRLLQYIKQISLYKAFIYKYVYSNRFLTKIGLFYTITKIYFWLKIIFYKISQQNEKSSTN